MTINWFFAMDTNVVLGRTFQAACCSGVAICPPLNRRQSFAGKFIRLASSSETSQVN